MKLKDSEYLLVVWPSNDGEDLDTINECRSVEEATALIKAVVREDNVDPDDIFVYRGTKLGVDITLTWRASVAVSFPTDS